MNLLVDDIDSDLIRDYNCYLQRGKYVVFTGGKYAGKALHRVIANRAGLDTSRFIIHIDGNLLNNKRNNLQSRSQVQETALENLQLDELDKDLIKDYNWILQDGYVIGSNGKYMCIRLHRIIAKRMGLDPNKEVDHIDGNPQNNHRCNLREATSSQNKMNSKLRSTNTSGYKGVCRNARGDKWQAAITVNYKSIHLGLFDSLKEAYKVRCAAEIKYFGEYRRQ